MRNLPKIAQQIRSQQLIYVITWIYVWDPKMIDHRAVRLHKLYMGQLEGRVHVKFLKLYSDWDTEISFRMAGALDQHYTRGSAGIPQITNAEGTGPSGASLNSLKELRFIFWLKDQLSSKYIFNIDIFYKISDIAWYYMHF
jgi:hypothetical protein